MIARSKSPRVLIVDDHEDTREMLVLLLNPLGVELAAVSTASQALRLSQTESFDLYLLDAWLSDLDGVELCRRLRMIDPHAFVVFFSGAAYESDRQKAMDAGANAYVCKPAVDELISTISKFTAESAGSAARAVPGRNIAPLQLVTLSSFILITDMPVLV